MHQLPNAVAASTPSSQLPQGFTLVELLIATVVLAVGLVALTSAGAAIVKLEGRGQQLARVAAMAETRLELLRSQRCAAAPGAGSKHGLEERWRVAQSATRTLALVDSIELHADGSASLRSVYEFRSAVRC
ncbi:MAG TPA: prepilin-type N-terminal cleavage/methylation domain-containing protein [Gemmatimonadaceae bacterium]|nr:prepilin-type N-terminal cleavage/methylation domain-containing protein [Gemmatimonadaceae bacterium]